MMIPPVQHQISGEVVAHHPPLCHLFFAERQPGTEGIAAGDIQMTPTAYFFQNSGIRRMITV